MRTIKTVSESSRQIPLPVSLDVDARFETYFSGPNAACVAALKVLPAPGVWLAADGHGGRSHLLQAVAAQAVTGRSLYLPLTADVPAQSIAGLAANSTVCLDDVDTVAGQSDWEQALFALYESLLRGGGRLLVSASQRPAQSGFAMLDLVSRFSALTYYRLQPLDDDGLVKALQLRARQRGFELPGESAQFLIKRLPREPATLFEWLRALDMESLSAKRRLTLPFVRERFKRLRDAGQD